MLQTLNNIEFAGNELSRLFLFFIVILVFLVAGKLISMAINRIVKQHKGGAEKESKTVFLEALIKPALIIALAFGVNFGLLVLRIAPRLEDFLSTLTSVLNAVAAGYLVYSLVDVVDYYLMKWAGRTDSKVDDALAPLVGKAVRIMVMVLVVLNVVVKISKQDITTIIASLGVGGLAIALAGQDTIKNFFGSIVIFGDKPFEIGDRIVVDGHDGPVETVGFRSTKIRTLDGHLVTVPNSEMVNKVVQNIGKRPYIKRVANITITYDTAPAKVDRAIEIIKEILDNHEGMDSEFPPRVYFSDFLDSSLNIVVIYWYHPPEYWDYMAFSERVNMQILNRFNDEGIEFAFPTQTLYIQK